MSDEASTPAPTAPIVTVTPVSTGSVPNEIPTIDVTPQTIEEKLGTVDAPVVESPPVVEPPKEKNAAKLAKIREREARAAAREAEADRKLAEASTAAQSAQQSAALLESLKSNPTKVLAELGISFNDLATALLNEQEAGDSTPSELDGVKQTLADIQNQLKAKEDKEKNAVEASQQAQFETAVADIKVVIDNHIKDNSDSFDLILATNNHELVYEIMVESFNQTGTVMDYKEACQTAEDYLTDKMQALTAASKKVKTFVSPPAPEKPKTSFGRTLSNQVTQMAAAASKGPDLSKLSHEERVKILAKQLRFN